MVVQVEPIAETWDMSGCPAPQASGAKEAWVKEWDTWIASAALSFHLSSSLTNCLSETGTDTD